jgi:hypothetical protein
VQGGPGSAAHEARDLSSSSSGLAPSKAPPAPPQPLVPPHVVEQIAHMEAHAAKMRRQLDAKDEELRRERRMLARFKELERQIEQQLRQVTQVCAVLAAECSRVSLRKRCHLCMCCEPEVSHSLVLGAKVPITVSRVAIKNAGLGVAAGESAAPERGATVQPADQPA